MIHGKDKWWEGIFIWIAPIVLILFIILIVYLIKRKSRKSENEFEGELNG